MFGLYMMTPKQKIEREGVLTTAHHDYERGMDSYAFSKVHSHATGQDLVQDTFIKTWRYLVRGGGDCFDEVIFISHPEPTDYR